MCGNVHGETHVKDGMYMEEHMQHACAPLGWGAKNGWISLGKLFSATAQKALPKRAITSLFMVEHRFEARPFESSSSPL
jgi:hypothetical protein